LIDLLQFQTSKQKILEFLSEFIQKIGKKISHYGLEIKVSFKVLSNNKKKLEMTMNFTFVIHSNILELSVSRMLNCAVRFMQCFTNFQRPLKKQILSEFSQFFL
jgi:hypothetical protein